MSWRSCFEYPKELCELHNDSFGYRSNKNQKRKLVKYLTWISDFYKIDICNVKKLMSNFFNK